jgi:hypothetical protein
LAAFAGLRGLSVTRFSLTFNFCESSSVREMAFKLQNSIAPTVPLDSIAFLRFFPSSAFACCAMSLPISINGFLSSNLHTTS